MRPDQIQQLIDEKYAFLIIRLPDSNKLLEFTPSFTSNENGSAFIVDSRGMKTSFVPGNQYLRTEQNITDTIQPVISDKNAYQRQFDKIKKAIQNKETDKVILSRILSEPLSNNQIGTLFFALCDHYATSCNYLYHNNGETWIGLSPELLASNINGEITCTSLAGTQPLEGTWTEKEKEEQAIVTRYIQNVMEKHGSVCSSSGIRNKIAGPVKHLETVIKGKVWNYESFLNDLHPTPAIGGYPKEKAIHLISETEPHNRELYTGYLRVSIAGQDLAFVNIRCMKHINNTAYLYIGGGITIDSDCEEEWKETELKASILLKEIRKL